MGQNLRHVLQVSLVNRTTIEIYDSKNSTHLMIKAVEMPKGSVFDQRARKCSNESMQVERISCLGLTLLPRALTRRRINLLSPYSRSTGSDFGNLSEIIQMRFCILLFIHAQCD